MHVVELLTGKLPLHSFQSLTVMAALTILRLLSILMTVASLFVLKSLKWKNLKLSIHAVFARFVLKEPQNGNALTSKDKRLPKKGMKTITQ